MGGIVAVILPNSRNNGLNDDVYYLFKAQDALCKSLLHLASAWGQLYR